MKYFKAYFSPTMCSTLKQEASNLLRKFVELKAPDPKQFTQKKFSFENYYDEKKERLCFFFEKKSIPYSILNYRGFPVKKISYQLHFTSARIKEFATSAKVQHLLLSVKCKAPLLVQTMFHIKHPNVASQVMCHQDSSYLYTEPDSLVTLWIALDDFTGENGCLHISEEHQELKFRLLREKTGKLTYRCLDASPWSLDRMQAAEVPKGSVVILSGREPHLSYPNRTTRATYAFSLHFISKTSAYCKSNWLQPSTTFPFLKI